MATSQDRYGTLEAGGTMITRILFLFSFLFLSSPAIGQVQIYSVMDLSGGLVNSIANSLMKDNQFTILDNLKYDEFGKKMGNIEGSMKNVEGSLSTMEGTMKNVDGRLEKVEGGITNFGEGINNIGSDIREIKDALVTNITSE